VEHRHGRAWSDLLRRGQQSVCLQAARRNTYAYTYRHRYRYCNCKAHGYGDSDSNSNRYSDGHADSYSNPYCNSSA